MAEKLCFIVVGMVIMAGISGIWKSYKHLVRKREVELVQGIGVYTDEQFYEEATKMFQENPEIPFALISLDIDNFKYINEVYGYQKGTKVLEIVGASLQEQKHDRMIIGKLVADQFVILTWDMNYTKLFEKYQDNYATLLQLFQHELQDDYNVTFSIGVYFVRDHSLPLSHMIDCASIAQKMGKKQVKNTIHYYTDELHSTLQYQNEIVASMHEGIKNNEFVVYYQSKVDLVTEKIVGMEALVRWKRNNTLLSPNKFISIFEQNGFIEQLDMYVLEEVCKYIAKNPDMAKLHMAVNLSGVTLLQEGIVVQILNIVEKYQVNPKYLELELTETAFAEVTKRTIQKLEQLRSYGFKISMDDFGTGISSLYRLKALPFDYLKIDRAFLADIAEDYSGRVIVASIIDMAQKLKLQVIAEGVEKEEHVSLLKKLHCNIAQGYYYAKPVPPEEIIIK